MDPIVTALINLGATGMLAAVLFYLHTTALKALQEDLGHQSFELTIIRNKGAA